MLVDVCVCGSAQVSAHVLLFLGVYLCLSVCLNVRYVWVFDCLRVCLSKCVSKSVCVCAPSNGQIVSWL